MATSVISRILAALAALFILASCSGGDSDIAPQQVSVQVAPFVGTPIAGTTVGGSTRRQALAASSEAPRPTFNVSFQPTVAAALFTKKAALAAVAASEAISIEQLFDWAEGAYPQYFPVHRPTANGDYNGVNYDFRCYSTLADNCVGVAQSGADIGGIYGIGPYTGGILVRFGHIRDDAFRCAVTDCGPKLLSAKLQDMKTGVAVDANGATGVAAKGTKLVLTYDQLDCTGVGGTGVVGQLILAISCAENQLTVVPGNPADGPRWTFGSDVTFSVAGLRNAAGYTTGLFEVTFSTKVAAAGQGAKVYVANYEATAEGGHDVTIIDAATQTIRPVNLGDTPNSVSPQRLAIDPVAGVVHVGAGGDRFYRFDIETGTSLTSLYPDPTNEYPGFWHTEQGLVIAGQDICAAMGRQDFNEYVYRNRLLCWNRYTLQPSFRSNSDYLAGRSMVVMEAVAVPERNTFYVLAAEALAYNLVLDVTGRTLKQEFMPGSSGTVYELDANTKAVKRTFVVGAGPRSAVYDAARKQLIVANSGKTAAGNIELSAIDLERGQVTPKRLAGFTGDQRPQSVVLAQGQLWVSDYVSAVVALDPTFAETQRVQVGAYPVFFAEVGGRLYVPLPRENFGGDKVAVVNPVTYSLESVIPVGKAPWYVTGFVPGP